MLILFSNLLIAYQNGAATDTMFLKTKHPSDIDVALYTSKCDSMIRSLCELTSLLVYVTTIIPVWAC